MSTREEVEKGHFRQREEWGQGSYEGKSLTLMAYWRQNKNWMEIQGPAKTCMQGLEPQATQLEFLYGGRILRTENDTEICDFFLNCSVDFWAKSKDRKDESSGKYLDVARKHQAMDKQPA